MTSFDAKDKPTTRITHTYKQVTHTPGGISARLEQQMTDSKGQPISTGTYELNCQNGIVKLNIADMMGPGMMMQNAAIKLEVSGDALELPSNLAVGQTLKDATFHLKGIMGEVKLMDRDFIIKERKVEDKETIETPAGKFDCFKVSYLTETTGMMRKTRTLKSVTWFAKGPGMVRNESYDEKGKRTGYMLLTAYTK